MKEKGILLELHKNSFLRVFIIVFYYCVLLLRVFIIVFILFLIDCLLLLSL